MKIFLGALLLSIMMILLPFGGIWIIEHYPAEWKIGVMIIVTLFIVIWLSNIMLINQEIKQTTEKTIDEKRNITDTKNKPTHRNKNVGLSNYASKKIQPWDIWLEYPELTSWDHDIIKRVLRTKKGESRLMEYEKIIHICEERIRQISEEEITEVSTTSTKKV